jgi:hypothetical protein
VDCSSDSYNERVYVKKAIVAPTTEFDGPEELTRCISEHMLTFVNNSVKHYFNNIRLFPSIFCSFILSLYKLGRHKYFFRKKAATLLASITSSKTYSGSCPA